MSETLIAPRDVVPVEPFVTGARTFNGESQVEGVEEMGMVRLTRKAVQSIEATGLSASDFGATRFADGCAALTASSLLKLLERLSQQLDEKNISKEDLQLLAQSMTQVAKSMVGLTGVMKGRAQVFNNHKPATISFPAHAKVTFVENQTIVQPEK